MYYRLTNYYQNHRRYVNSLDANQLKGDAVELSNIEGGACSPMDVAPDGKIIYPFVCSPFHWFKVTQSTKRTCRAKVRVDCQFGL